MKLSLFAILDTATAAYENPWVAPTTAAALRAFGDAVKQPESPFAKHPADYLLHAIGIFDTETGTIEPHQVPMLVARATEHVPPEHVQHVQV